MHEQCYRMLMPYDKRHYKMEVANSNALLKGYPENIEKTLKKFISQLKMSLQRDHALKKTL